VTTAVNDIEWAAAKRLLAAFRRSMAFGSSAGLVSIATDLSRGATFVAACGDQKHTQREKQ
jgi:hypothetical protein